MFPSLHKNVDTFILKCDHELMMFSIKELAFLKNKKETVNDTRGPPHYNKRYKMFFFSLGVFFFFFFQKEWTSSYCHSAT